MEKKVLFFNRCSTLLITAGNLSTGNTTVYNQSSLASFTIVKLYFNYNIRDSVTNGAILNTLGYAEFQKAGRNFQDALPNITNTSALGMYTSNSIPVEYNTSTKYSSGDLFNVTLSFAMQIAIANNALVSYTINVGYILD